MKSHLGICAFDARDDGGQAIISHTPMARFGESSELVGATILLASNAASSFITGAAYYVDGGFTAMRF